MPIRAAPTAKTAPPTRRRTSCRRDAALVDRSDLCRPADASAPVCDRARGCYDRVEIRDERYQRKDGG